jgi:hypothetical protein
MFALAAPIQKVTKVRMGIVLIPMFSRARVQW